MRRILFRGYDKVGHKGWVYGDLVHGKGISADPSVDIYPRVMVGGYEVCEDSAGEYIGLKDVNRRDIYEGDIVEVKWDGSDKVSRGVVELNGACFGIVTRITARGKKVFSAFFGYREIKIVGTVFESKNHDKV